MTIKEAREKLAKSKNPANIHDVCKSLKSIQDDVVTTFIHDDEYLEYFERLLDEVNKLAIIVKDSSSNLGVSNG